MRLIVIGTAEQTNPIPQAGVVVEWTRSTNSTNKTRMENKKGTAYSSY